jgi:hypothetical protein
VRIRNSSETVFVTIWTEYGVGVGADSVRIRIWNRSLSEMNMDQIWSKYGSVVDKHFFGSLVDNKVKLACKCFYIHKHIFI